MISLPSADYLPGGGIPKIFTRRHPSCVFGKWDNSGKGGPAVGEGKFVANRVQVLYRQIYI